MSALLRSHKDGLNLQGTIPALLTQTRPRRGGSSFWHRGTSADLELLGIAPCVNGVKLVSCMWEPKSIFYITKFKKWAVLMTRVCKWSLPVLPMIHVHPFQVCVQPVHTWLSCTTSGWCVSSSNKTMKLLRWARIPMLLHHRETDVCDISVPKPLSFLHVPHSVSPLSRFSANKPLLSCQCSLWYIYKDFPQNAKWRCIYLNEIKRRHHSNHGFSLIIANKGRKGKQVLMTKSCCSFGRKHRNSSWGIQANWVSTFVCVCLLSALSMNRCELKKRRLISED